MKRRFHQICRPSLQFRSAQAKWFLLQRGHNSLAARKRVIDNFDIESVTDKVLKIYKDEISRDS